MRIAILLTGSVLALSVISGCADERSDLEKARYLLGSGSKADAVEALSLVTPLLTSQTGAQKVEAYRLYAGAKMQSVGFSGVEILPALIYPTKNGSTIKTANMLKDAFTGVTDNDAAAAALLAAIDALHNIAGLPDFSAASTTEQKGIYFQRALAEYFDALRIVIVKSRFSDPLTTSANFDQSDCATRIDATTSADASTNADVGTRLTNADTYFGTGKADLDATNQVRKSASDLRTSIGTLSAANICTYLSTQF